MDAIIFHKSGHRFLLYIFVLIQISFENLGINEDYDRDIAKMNFGQLYPTLSAPKRKPE